MVKILLEYNRGRIEMKIRKVTFKNNQAWLSIEDDNGEYLGTWHVVDITLVNVIRKSNLDNFVLKFEEKLS